VTKPLQYMTNEQGERVGVVLDWNTYTYLSQHEDLDENVLIGLSTPELQALANCKLALVTQTRLDTLIAKNSESQLSIEEQTELDDLLAKADQLTILKTRARYTLHCQEGRTVPV
jgi:hypothetical protein